MIDLTKSVFLVDGQSEIRAFKSKFAKEYKHAPEFRIVGCNGKNVTAEGYVNAAYGTLIEALNRYFTTIVCVIDKERRRESAMRFAHAVRTAIIDRITRSTKFAGAELERKTLVCVPDIMFENWIVADVEGIKEHQDLIKGTATQDKYDGKSGSTLLRRMMNVRYKKTSHGPKLFKSVRFDIARSNSPSFERFADALELP